MPTDGDRFMIPRLTVGVVLNDMKTEERREAYEL